jgi:hypothetical protein
MHLYEMDGLYILRPDVSGKPLYKNGLAICLRR